MSTPAAVLETRGVWKEYPGGTVALQDVDLRVEAGETLVLIGESGSGKTTLLRLFNRMVEPSRGTVRADGRNLAGEDAVALRRRTGYVQQNGGLLPHWTVGRNVELVPVLLKWTPDQRRRRAQEVLDLVGLEPSTYLDRYPAALSGGQRQRVALARALAANPPVLLLDEPFGALDPLTRTEIQKEFLTLVRQLAQTTVLVTHDLPEAVRLADRIGVLKDGRLLQTASPTELLRDPRPGYVAELVSHLEAEP